MPMLTERERRHTIDRASGRIISAGPEEIDATQPLLDALIREAGWDPRQIVSRPRQWRVPSSPSGRREWPVDVAVFDNPDHLRDPEHVIMFCECKRRELDIGVEQLKIYMDREPHVRLGIWFNGIDYRVVYKTPDGYRSGEPGTPIPRPNDPWVPLGTRVLTLESLREAPSLVPVFRRIRDRIATLDKNVNRDEEILPDLSLLLLLKILDEQSGRLNARRPLSFQISQDVGTTARRMRTALEEQVRRNPELFGASDREIAFQIDDDSIYYVVSSLQNFRLLSNETDAVAEAFQVIRGKAYKGEEGQYFTPQSVVKVALAAVDPSPEDRIIDPACGSGSFLATGLNHVIDKLARTIDGDATALSLAKREWSTQRLFAVDKDSVSVRLSKAYLSMLGDGSTHVWKMDSIRPSLWPNTLRATIQDGAFDVVVTNPPFGTKLKVPPQVGREEGYDLSRQWVRENGQWSPNDDYVRRDLGLIFLERSIRFLRPGGRLAIVLPDTYLFSDSYGWLVQWLGKFTITHSINVPIEAFEPHCRAKTSVIVIKKTPPPPNHQIIGALCETYGEDKHGRPRFKFVDGSQTSEIDDEMGDVARLLTSRATAPKSRLHFTFRQDEALSAGVLVASYWWRQPYLEALQEFADTHDCDLYRLGDLMDDEHLEVFAGHGSPKSHYINKGTVPYVKVVDIKNWRVIENPTYAIPEDVARTLRRGRDLCEYDLVTPTRASKNIGMFGVIMPWQTNVVLTREIAVWRVNPKSKLLDRWLLLALMSLKVVHDQFRFLVLMQMNREDLGARYREILLPIPRSAEMREAWGEPVREYLNATTRARKSYEALLRRLDPEQFIDRP